MKFFYEFFWSSWKCLPYRSQGGLLALYCVRLLVPSIMLLHKCLATNVASQMLPLNVVSNPYEVIVLRQAYFS